MITSQDKQLITHLIMKYAGNISTEAMIAFVADTNGMLSVCKSLVSSNNNDDQLTISWVDEQCNKRKVDIRGFLFEVERILSIFLPGHEVEDYYAVLDLHDGASDEEIKKAYRQLSRKYHPDTASSNDVGNGDMFIRITKAYHVLMGGDESSTRSLPSIHPANHWREQKKNHISRERKKKNLFWFAALASVMIVASLIVANNYKERVMIAGLQNMSAAFIPPDSQAQPVEQEDKQLGSVENKTEQPELTENATVAETTEPPVQIVVTVSPDPVQQPLPPKKPGTVVKKKTEEAITQTVTEISTPEIQLLTEKPTEEKVIKVKEELPVERVKLEPKIATPLKKKKSVIQSTVEQTAKAQSIPSIVKQEPVVLTSVEIRENTKQKVDSFLYDYIQSYENKDLLAFTRFFDLKATENGKPLAEILPTYSELFQIAETMTLTVTVLKWVNTQNMIKIEGRFKNTIQYKKGGKVKGTGMISFLLLDNDRQFLIKEMTYQFDN